MTTKKQLLSQARLCRRLDKIAEEKAGKVGDLRYHLNQAEQAHHHAEIAYKKEVEKMQRMGGKTPDTQSFSSSLNIPRGYVVFANGWRDIIAALGGASLTNNGDNIANGNSAKNKKEK